MSKFPQLRILHLSDFHYHTRTKGGLSNHICDPPDPTGSTAGFPLLLDLVQKDLNSADWSNFGWALGGPGLPVPRLIVAATGDFAHTARGDEFDKAQAFLAGLCDASCKNPILGSRVSARDIFVVPGNHDVIYDQKEPKHRFSRLLKKYPASL
jgi:3',5'-cyclic AMP phosphodiesterase CpdA